MTYQPHTQPWFFILAQASRRIRMKELGFSVPMCEPFATGPLLPPNFEIRSEFVSLAL
jgi:hypothetical protein